MINFIKYVYVKSTCIYLLILNFRVLHSLTEFEPEKYNGQIFNYTQLQFQCKNGQNFEEPAKDFFRCNDGTCIDKEFKCDGVKHCWDGSDEWATKCDTPSNKIRKKRASGGHCAAPSRSPDKTVTYDCDGNANSKSCIVDGLIRELTFAQITCNPNYKTLNNTSLGSVCRKGVWWPPIDRCHKICDELTPINVNLECYRQNTEISCARNSLLAGVRVLPTCKELHTFKDYVPTYNEIICQENGKWDKNLFTCTPVCGRPYTKATTLISNGTEEHIGDSPWHVAIYNRNKILICGGTIVHSFLVLSAAHCFYNEADSGRLEDADHYEVVVSKVSRDYNTKDNKYQKVFEIKEIRSSERKGYYHLENYHASDIVILILQEELTISPTVLPACIDVTHRKWYPPEGTLAKVSGWGKNEHDELSKRLHTANLPFISRQRCIETVPVDFKPYITFDKFCAGSETGAGVLQGDSGGGLLFQEGGFFILRGIVSIKQPSLTKIAAFTDIADHIDWILAICSEMDREIAKKKSSLLSEKDALNLETNLHHFDEEPIRVPSEDDTFNFDEKLQYFDKELLAVTYKSKSKENTAVSPAGIKVMLAMLLEGASGRTELELKNALRLPKDKRLALSILYKQYNILKNASSAGVLEKGKEIFVAINKKLSTRYSDILTTKYTCRFQYLNFHLPDAAVQAINNGGYDVSKSVNSSIISKNDFDASTKLLLVDYTYLRSGWEFIFDPKVTYVNYFYNSNETESKVKYMMAYMHVNYHEDDEIEAKIVEIPFKDKRYTLTMILPNKKDGITRLVKDLLHISLMSRLFSNTKDLVVHVTLPKTTIQCKTLLANILSSPEIGIKNAFTNASTANLTGILKMNEPVSVGNIVHNVNIEIHEGLPSKIVLIKTDFVPEFKADHPFVFFIRDIYDSEFLFEGVLVAPDTSNEPITNPSLLQW